MSTTPNLVQPIGIDVLHAHLEGMLATTEANVYWKDHESKYLGANDVFIHDAGVGTSANIIGTTDADQVWKKQAKLMMTNDRYVIQTGTIKTDIELARMPDDNIVHFLSHKSPLRNRMGKIIGVLGLSYNLDNNAWGDEKFIEIGTMLGSHALHQVKRYLLKHQKQDYQLSKRQLDCLYYYAKGMTINEIATTLSLSKRTVEHYLEAVKAKMNCTSRAEVIAKAERMELLDKHNEK